MQTGAEFSKGGLVLEENSHLGLTPWQLGFKTANVESKQEVAMPN